MRKVGHKPGGATFCHAQANPTGNLDGDGIYLMSLNAMF